MFAHIAGVPVEETAFSLGPVVFVVGTVASVRLRERVLRHRARKPRPMAWGPTARGRR